MGMAYYWAENNNLSLNVGATTDFFAPIGPADIEGPWRSSYNDYIDIRSNHLYDLFEIGAGLSVARMGWSIRQDTVPGPEKGDSQFLDVSTVHAAYRLTQRGSIGLMNHPYFLRFDDRLRFLYQHHISLVLTVEREIFN
jgi:hypothetical protein